MAEVLQAPRAAWPDPRDPVLVQGGGLRRGGVRRQPRRFHVGGRAPADGWARRADARPAAVRFRGQDLSRAISPLNTPARRWPAASLPRSMTFAGAL